MEKREYDIFISYSSVDKNIAFILCSALELEGINCWIAPRNVGTGSYANSIVEGIENSKALVLLFSSHSNDSLPVLNEVEVALNNKLPIIPIRIEEIFPSKAMKYYLMSNNWFDAFNAQSLSDFKEFTMVVKNTIQKKDAQSIHKKTKYPLPKKKKKANLIILFTLVIAILSFLLLFNRPINTISTQGIIQSLSTTVKLQAQELKQKNEKIKELEKKYKKELKRNKDKPRIISQAEHIKDIAGYTEALKYFKDTNKKTFYNLYDNINLTSNNICTSGQCSVTLNEVHKLYIQTIPKTAKIKIYNKKKEYKYNQKYINLYDGIYTVHISNDNYIDKEFKININKDSTLAIELEPIAEGL